jgi:glycosyltransferase involved in cell wall biosynthesis
MTGNGTNGGRTRRKVLYVTFDFPPRRTSAVYRHVGLNRYLGNFGWSSTILTARSRPGETEDPGLLQEFPPDIAIDRTSTLRLGAWEKPAASTIRKVGLLRSPSTDPRQSWLDRRLRQVADVVQNIIHCPDETVGWVPFGFARALALHMQHRYDLLYTSSPPRSAPLVGWLMKFFTGIPWIAEFRDPWHPAKYPWRTRFERWLLSRLVRKADAIVLISEGLADELKANYAADPRKVFVVSNGFDERDFEEPPSSSTGLFPAGFIHLAHFGTIYPGFSGVFFPALKELMQERPDLRQFLRVHIIGYTDDDESRRYLRDEAFDGILLKHDFMPQAEALQAMAASSALLLFLGDPRISRLSGLGKIYWYLRVGRPIFAIAPQGGTRDLIEAGHAGWVVDPQDMAGIKRALLEVIEECRNGASSRRASPEFVAQFRYDRLAGRLADVLNGVAHGRRA